MEKYIEIPTLLSPFGGLLAYDTITITMQVWTWESCSGWDERDWRAQTSGEGEQPC